MLFGQTQFMLLVKTKHAFWGAIEKKLIFQELVPPEKFCMLWNFTTKRKV